MRYWLGIPLSTVQREWVWLRTSTKPHTDPATIPGWYETIVTVQKHRMIFETAPDSTFTNKGITTLLCNDTQPPSAEAATAECGSCLGSGNQNRMGLPEDMAEHMGLSLNKRGERDEMEDRPLSVDNKGILNLLGYERAVILPILQTGGRHDPLPHSLQLSEGTLVERGAPTRGRHREKHHTNSDHYRVFRRIA